MKILWIKYRNDQIATSWLSAADNGAAAENDVEVLVSRNYFNIQNEIRR